MWLRDVDNNLIACLNCGGFMRSLIRCVKAIGTRKSRWRMEGGQGQKDEAEGQEEEEEGRQRVHFHKHLLANHAPRLAVWPAS